MRRFDKVFVLLEHELDLSKARCALHDEIEHALGDGHLAEAIEHLDDIVRHKADRDGSIETVRRQLVLVDERRPADGLSDCDEEVLRLFSDRRKAFEDDVTVIRADP